ncbi:hypothetical protein OG21DRAFT_1523842 [Imleria badia]|nr:hypothetical protein OG21DRAFT_1523842 [Imleria badia]
MYYPETTCLEVTKLWSKAGCSSSMLNADGELPMQIAVAMPMVSVVEYRLSQNAPFPPDILLTAVTVKARQSSSQVSRMTSLLVRHGADVSVCAVNGESVLHVALARKGYWFPCDSLLEIVTPVHAIPKDVHLSRWQSGEQVVRVPGVWSSERQSDGPMAPTPGGFEDIWTRVGTCATPPSDDDKMSL